LEGENMTHPIIDCDQIRKHPWSTPTWRFYCEHCKCHHVHGGEPDDDGIIGHRVAHCHVPGSPYEKAGYILRKRKPTTTQAWLAAAQITDDPAGDVIADMRRDPDIPALFKNIDAMRDYLRTKGACREALAALPIVWRRHQGWLGRNPCG
jgi:hypothetical protein